jgi:hypothetical protein
MIRKAVFTSLTILAVAAGAWGSMVAAQEETPVDPVSALQTGYPAPTEIAPEDDPDDFAYFTLSYQQEAVDLFLGKAGVFMPISYYTGTAVVYRIQQTPFYEVRDLDFVERFLDLHAFTVKGALYNTLWGVN